MPGKIVKLDASQLANLELLAKDREGTFQEIADEAFADLLKKYKRPTTLLGALKESVKHPEDSYGRQQTKGDNARKGAVRKRTQLKGPHAGTETRQSAFPVSRQGMNQESRHDKHNDPANRVTSRSNIRSMLMSHADRGAR